MPARLAKVGHARCYGFGRLGGRGRFGAYQRMAPVAWRTASCSSSSMQLDECMHADLEVPCPRTLPAVPAPPVFMYCYHAFRGGVPGKRSPGALALAPGATIDLPVDTRIVATTASDADGGGGGSGGGVGAGGGGAGGGGGGGGGGGVRHAKEGADAALVRVTLGYLTSYAGGMGRAEVSCHHGCRCPGSTLDGHRIDTDRNISVFAPHQIRVTGASASCVVRVRVLDESSTVGHKFKLSTLNVVADSDSGKATMVQPLGDDTDDAKNDAKNDAKSPKRLRVRRGGKGRGGRQ